MAKPTEDLNLAAEVNNYTGDDKSQGDPNSPEYVDPEAPELHGEDDEPSDEEDTEESDEAAEEDGEEDEEPEVDEKPKKNAKSRINELTAARREAERQAEYWRGKALEAQRNAQPVGTPEDEPDPSKYDYGEADPKYIRDLSRHEAKKALDEERISRAQVEHAQALQGGLEATISRGRTNFADFDEVVIKGADNKTWDCSEALAKQLITSEKGDEIAYHLAKNPAEARRLSALPDLSLAREIGKLEVRLDEPPVVKPKVVSDVPPPPKRTAKGVGRTGGFDVENSSFAEFEKWAQGAMNRRR